MSIREKFPILNAKVHGKSLIYLDSAATSQKPEIVISTESLYYREYNSNVHRAPHDLSEIATAAYESVREKVRKFLNAEHKDEIIFTKGTTDSVNLVASSLKHIFIKRNSEILLTELEHHSNIVPWQMTASEVGATIVAAKVSSTGEIDLGDFESKLNKSTSVVSFATVSNALGTVHPIDKIVSLVRKKSPDALIFIDGAQSVAHTKTDVQSLGVDFFAFSSHKAYGPTGVGVLYGRKDLLLKMPPVSGGGDMIDKVSFSGTTYAPPPFRFEAGTPNIAGVIGFGAALDFIENIKWEVIESHEREISDSILNELSKIDKVKVIGSPEKRMSAVSFIVEGMAPLDVAVKLNDFGVAVRAGHHCCMPLMEALGLAGTVRASWGIYTTKEEIKAFAESLRKIASERVVLANDDGEIIFGKQQAASPKDALNAIKQALISAEDSKSEYLLELGRAHPRRLVQLRALTPEVQGCMSEVRIITKISDDNRLFIASDSNSEIVRGLLAIVEQVFSGQLVEDINKIKESSIQKELELSGLISIQRRTGLESVLSVISKSIE